MIDFAELLHSWDDVSPEARQLALAFMAPESAGRRYVLGRNEHSTALMRAIEADAVVDDFAEPGSLWSGKPVIRGTEVPPRGFVVNCSMCSSPVTASRKLASLHVAGVLAFADLCRTYPDRVSLPRFVLQTRQDLEANRSRWEWLAASLTDAQSRQVLSDVLRYRTTGNYAAMSRYSVRPTDQYFEEFLNLAPGEVFVDAGGFDGATTEEFCRRCPGYRKVFLFEPSESNLQKARARLRGLDSVEFVNKGLSDAVGTLRFNADAGSASSVDETGSGRIHATTLDLQIQQQVSFIKMDLEGWELKALKGAERHIREDHSKLAIAVYHHASDFWRVFDYVMGLRPDYKVHLRHYTEGWSETVMFFCYR